MLTVWLGYGRHFEQHNLPVMRGAVFAFAKNHRAMEGNTQLGFWFSIT